MVSEAPTSIWRATSVISDSHYPECKETAKEVKVILQHTANGVDDVKRS
jgi:hypothetical protein